MLAAQRDSEIRNELPVRLDEARDRTDKLFDIIRSDSLYERPIPQRHRIIFYVGHLEAFDWNLLRERVVGTRAFHPEFDRLFAFGIDPVNGGLPSDQPADWPAVAEVRKYVRQVREAVDTGLSTSDSNSGRREEFPASLLLNVAIEHRLMHAETLTYMLHQLPLDRKVAQGRPPSLVAPPGTSRMIEIPAGCATLGIPRNDTSVFGWDNEYEVHAVNVPQFAVAEHKVSNGQFLEFLTSGGYDDRPL